MALSGLQSENAEKIQEPKTIVINSPSPTSGHGRLVDQQQLDEQRQRGQRGHQRRTGGGRKIVEKVVACRQRQRSVATDTSGGSFSQIKRRTASSTRSTRRTGTSTPSTAPPEKRRKLTKVDRDMTVCSTIISEMEAMDDACRFYIRQHKAVSHIQKDYQECDGSCYHQEETGCCSRRIQNPRRFVDDVRLIFTNCDLPTRTNVVRKLCHGLRTTRPRWQIAVGEDQRTSSTNSSRVCIRREQHPVSS